VDLALFSFLESSPYTFDMTDLEVLGAACDGCVACKLAPTRKNVVFGVGDPNANLMVIGEGPGEDEDRTGEPFVGRAGQLLDQILAAVQIPRESVYIANMVKCRPPGNRNPEPDEIASCEHWLLDQIRLIRPQIIVTLGNVPTQWALQSTTGITRARGQWGTFKKLNLPIPVLPMFHPAYLLRNPIRDVGGPKWLTWQDIKTVKAQLEKLGPKPDLKLQLEPEQTGLF
jgi:uracil-DNA glycosylase